MAYKGYLHENPIPQFIVMSDLPLSQSTEGISWMTALSLEAAEQTPTK